MGSKGELWFPLSILLQAVRDFKNNIYINKLGQSLAIREIDHGCFPEPEVPLRIGALIITICKYKVFTSGTLFGNRLIKDWASRLA